MDRANDRAAVDDGTNVQSSIVWVAGLVDDAPGFANCARPRFRAHFIHIATHISQAPTHA